MTWWPVTPPDEDARRHFNATWQRRRAQFTRLAPPPWWAPGAVIDATMRYHYELHLPVRAYLHDLRRVAASFLPHPSWLPGPLRRAQTGRPASRECPLSLPDLWASLPPHLAGRVALHEEALLPLLCALADPPRCGTAVGRYPRQAKLIRRWAESRRGCRLRVLDLGCGTGHGTYELAATVHAGTGVPALCCGVSREPLETWMARHRRLPHVRPARARPFPVPAPGDIPQFVAGDALATPLAAGVDLVVANGLIGGPLLRDGRDLGRLFGELERLLAANGLATFANCFHAGLRLPTTVLARHASEVGWRLRGDAALVTLRRIERS